MFAETLDRQGYQIILRIVMGDAILLLLQTQTHTDPNFYYRVDFPASARYQALRGARDALRAIHRGIERLPDDPMAYGRGNGRRTCLFGKTPSVFVKSR